MYIDKKFINEELNNLESEIEQEDKGFYINDTRYPSLKLWVKYERYLNKILFTFEANKEEEYKILAEIITLLRLDDFSVNASEDVENSRNALKDYIKDVRKRIAPRGQDENSL